MSGKWLREKNISASLLPKQVRNEAHPVINVLVDRQPCTPNWHQVFQDTNDHINMSLGETLESWYGNCRWKESEVPWNQLSWACKRLHVLFASGGPSHQWKAARFKPPTGVWRNQETCRCAPSESREAHFLAKNLPSVPKNQWEMILSRETTSVKTIATQKQSSIPEAVYWYNVMPKDRISTSMSLSNIIYTYNVWIQGIDTVANPEPQDAQRQYQLGDAVAENPT